MIPATTRRVASSSLTAQGRQVARKTCGVVVNVTVAQLGGRKFQQTRSLSQAHPSRSALNFALQSKEKKEKGDVKGESKNEDPLGRPEHAVISTFDLFSIGVGPSSSHTVGPMRAGNIFINDLRDLGILEQVKMVKIALYGSLAATGKGHHTPQAILLGLEGSDPETIDAGTIPARYQAMLDTKSIMLGGHHTIHYDHDRDMIWRYDQVLPSHPNGMRFSVFDEGGDLLATNEYFSVGGGFVVNEKTKTAGENLFYKGVDKRTVHVARLSRTTSGMDATQVEKDTDPTHPSYPFKSGDTLLALSHRHNMTIAQVVYDNELSFGYTDEEIHEKLLRIWAVMDDCIRTGVSTSEKTLPGRLGLHRRAPKLYRRLMRGFYPALSPSFPGQQRIGEGEWASGEIGSPDGFDDEPLGGNSVGTKGGPMKRESPVRKPAARVVGQFDHPMLPVPPRKTMIPAVDFLSCYAIAVNEVNAAGGRIVTSPTNGASGVIPSVLKYIIEFVSDDPQKSITTFLLTAAAVGMLFKRGSTISAAEGGCQAEVGVACSMAAAGFAACMGAPPETVLQAAEIGIEHNLGLTCDPIDGLVQVPCIERNSLGAVKAVTAAQLAMASDNIYRVSLDQAIEAMRLTAADMSVKYKETSLSGLATAVKIPLTVPTCESESASSPIGNVNPPLVEAIQEVGQEKHLLSSNRGEKKPVPTPAAYFNTFSLLAPLCAILTFYLTYTSFSLPDLDLSFRTNTLTYQNDLIPAALLVANSTCFAIVGPGESWLNLWDYLSVVFDEAPQTQLSPSIPSASDVTVTILDEDEGKPEEDPDKTITPADFYGDEDTLSVCASPIFSPLSPIFSDCPSLTSDHSSGDESSLSPTSYGFNHPFLFDSSSAPRINFDYDNPIDCVYPSYDPFEEDPDLGYEVYEDADEALAVISHRSQRKRYMVGLFPGVNESFLQRDYIPYDHFVTTVHKCLDQPGLNALDVRCCPYWYRCEKPDITDGDRELETTRILILNLNYSVVRDEAFGAVNRQVTVIYDSGRLKPILRELGATKMTIYCPADVQDYPYAVVDFPDIVQSRTAFQRLQGQCLGYSGRHLRVQYAPLYDYTFGGRHVIPEDTRDIVVVSLEPEQPQPARLPERKLDKGSSPTVSPQKNKYSRMVVTKHGRRIQIPSNLC